LGWRLLLWRKKKHFNVVDIEYDDKLQKILNCNLEALMAKRQTLFLPVELTNKFIWQQGLSLIIKLIE